MLVTGVQTCALPIFAGLAVTSSTEAIFGHVISDPIELLGRIGGPATTVLAIFGISLATLTTNIAANVVAPANAFVSMSPRRFTFAQGALITALLGIACQPWRLLSSSESFVYTWLLGYSALMGPIGGVILADHYIVRACLTDPVFARPVSSEYRVMYRKFGCDSSIPFSRPRISPLIFKNA